MESEPVRVEREGPVVTVILNRPEARNAVNGATARGLSRAFREFEADSEARVAVLYGEGGTFCAGADLKALASGNDPCVLEETGDGPLGPTRMTLSKPVIAAISGYAVAGGLELALWCDLRVVERTATFGAFERRWGVPLVDGGTIRLPRLIGMSRALDLILTGRPVPATEAFEIGLANRLVEPGTAREEAEKLAREIAAFPQQCLRNDRLSLYEQHGLPLAAALENETRRGFETIRSGELLSGASRFTSGEGRHGAR